MVGVESTKLAALVDQLRSAQLAVLAADSAALKLEALRPQLVELRTALDRARSRHLKERADVAKLEGWSMRRIATSLGGSRLTELEREQAEAQAAAYELAIAEQRVQQTETREAELHGQASALHEAVETRERILTECSNTLLIVGDDRGQQLRRAAEDLAIIENEQRELAEALSAAEVAARVMREAWSLLSSARSWSTYDTFFGGGLIGDAFKYDRIEQATRQLQAADQAMRRLAVELADVGMGPTRGVEITQMTRAFDIWFDNIFSDWAVRNRIEEAAARLAESRRALLKVQEELSRRQQDARKRHHDRVAERELMIDQLTAG